MKYIAALCASFLTAYALVSVFPSTAESEIYDDVLRLHVIAESDSDEDQELKLRVRDTVLGYLSDELDDCDRIDEACVRCAELLDEIESAALECVRENGSSAEVKAELVSEKYPRREYGEVVMPAGRYKSLKITIGGGEGHNWWCVLFPGCCTPFAGDKTESAAVGLTPEEYRIISGGTKWKIKFRLLEVLSSLFD